MEALEHELADAKLAVESAQLVSSTLQASQKEKDKLRSKLRVLIDANGKLKAQLNGAADSPAVRDLRAQLGAMSLESSAARATLLEVPPSSTLRCTFCPHTVFHAHTHTRCMVAADKGQTEDHEEGKEAADRCSKTARRCGCF